MTRGALTKPAGLFFDTLWVDDPVLQPAYAKLAGPHPWVGVCKSCGLAGVWGPADAARVPQRLRRCVRCSGRGKPTPVPYVKVRALQAAFALGGDNAVRDVLRVASRAV